MTAAARPLMRLAAMLLVALLAAMPALARDAGAEKEIAVADLPREARETLMHIRQGGPFPFRQDGAVFGNRERLLPARPRGHYREYTVKTPGAPDRGARRVVAGTGEGGDTKTSDEFWYTDDHYKSYRRIKLRKKGD